MKVLDVLGLALLTAGTGLAWLPLGLATAGIACLWLSWSMAAHK